jgi:hypothetical protein
MSFFKQQNVLLFKFKRKQPTMHQAIKASIAVFLVLWVGSAMAQERSTREAKPFHSLEVSSGIDLYIKQGNEETIEVICDKEYIKRIETEVQDSVLTIKAVQPMRWGFDKSPKVYVTFKQLRSLIATSGADVYGTGIFQLQMMSVSVHNGADIYITLECERLKLNASGGSDIKVSGKAKSLNANIASGSDLNAADFKVDNCDINVSGGSDAIVNVSVSIFADASGGSDIGYIGSPKIKELNESGGSDIYRK